MAIRTIEVREKVMARNDEIAAAVRSRLAAHGIPAFNLISSPGSGKTLLLERTLEALGDRLRMAVVSGDVQTRNDAERLNDEGPAKIEPGREISERQGEDRGQHHRHGGDVKRVEERFLEQRGLEEVDEIDQRQRPRMRVLEGDIDHLGHGHDQEDQQKKAEHHRERAGAQLTS